jgi:nucleoside-diphosphate-sugar epimerase
MRVSPNHIGATSTLPAIVRIFNTYGPRMSADDGRAIPNFIAQALAGRALTVYGNGRQTRSFTYIDDLVEGLVLLAGHAAARGAIVNLGNPEEVAIADVADAIASADDPSRRKPDITRARTLLGWEPKIGLRAGIDRTLNWWRSARSAADA